MTLPPTSPREGVSRTAAAKLLFKVRLYRRTGDPARTCINESQPESIQNSKAFGPEGVGRREETGRGDKTGSQVNGRSNTCGGNKGT